MCSNTTKAYLNDFQQLLKAVDYPMLNSYDGETEILCRLFQNIDDQDKQNLFKWIVTQFDVGLESYALSDEKLRYLLHRTGLIDSKIICADFLSGLLPHEEQIDIWKNILMVVYYHKKKKTDVKSEQMVENKDSNKSESVSPKSQRINLLPPEYQKDFEEQTRGNFSDYIETMKNKLLSKEVADFVQDNECDAKIDTASMEDTIKKLLDLKNPPVSNMNDPSSLDFEVMSQFCSNYEKLVKPHVGQVLDESSNQNVIKLDHFGEFLQEYAFMTKVLESFKVFATYQDMISDQVNS